MALLHVVSAALGVVVEIQDAEGGAGAESLGPGVSKGRLGAAVGTATTPAGVRPGKSSLLN